MRKGFPWDRGEGEGEKGGTCVESVDGDVAHFEGIAGYRYSAMDNFVCGKVWNVL